MRITLDNGCIQVAVDTYGGELQSLKRHDAVTEYLWQGNPATYRRKAINIFPYVARLTNGTARQSFCSNQTRALWKYIPAVSSIG